MQDEIIETTGIFEFLKNADEDNPGKKFLTLEGASGSGKTWGTIDFILDWCRKHSFEDKVATIGRESYQDCKATVLSDFLKRLRQIGWYNQNFHTQSHPQSYELFGNKIDFTGWSTNGQPSKRQDLLWFNEILESKEEAFKQYNQRTNEIVIADWNPKYTDHWAYRNLLDRPNCFYRHCLLPDNPFLPEGQLQEILAYEPTAENIKNGTADDYMWKVYGLGERAAATGLVFKHVYWIDELPENLMYAYGLDFGYTNDPTALVKAARVGRNIYAKLLLYEPLDNAQAISDYMEEIGIEKYKLITADSSDRYNDVEMVKELKDLGWKIKKVNKGKGLNWRLGLLKKHRLNFVHDLNIKREQENYKWREVNGILINQPIDKYNHFFDALGYWYLGNYENKSKMVIE